jgi:hypothetical protein
MKSRPTFCSLQRDALLVLADAQQSRWKVPAEALYEAIRQQGWVVRWGPLGKGKLCLCDFRYNTLILSSDVDPEQSPKVRQRMLHWILAAELGNIRYHIEAGLNASYRFTEEQVSEEYAMAFLLPLHLLREHPEVIHLLKTPSTLPCLENWRRLLSKLADHFGVPPRCAHAALLQYGLLEPTHWWSNQHLA